MAKLRMLILLTCSIAGVPHAIQAGEAQEYCNELYPADAYDAEDRSLYIKECLDSYVGDEPAEQDDEDEGYYDGTVEEFINESALVE